MISSSTHRRGVLLATVGGPAGQRALATINRLMVEHADVLVAALVVLIGIEIVGDGTPAWPGMRRPNPETSRGVPMGCEV